MGICPLGDRFLPWCKFANRNRSSANIEMRLRFIIAVFASWLILCHEPARSESEYDPGLPFTWLFDTGSPSFAPLGAKALADKDGWMLVGEDILDHSFRGDAVLLNDRLAVVFRAKGPGAEVYSLVDSHFVNRAVLAAVPEADTAISVTGLGSIGIVENSPASVVIEAAFATSVAGRQSSSAFGITTGQRMVELRPKSGADRLFAWYRPRWIVVPDFFGDDMVFDAQAARSPRFGLPAENFSLGLIHGNSAMLMSVWESGGRRSYLIPPGKAADETVAGYEIEGVEDEPVWYAFFEGTGLWYEEEVSAGQAGDDVSVDFQPPFEGRWRADLVSPDGVSQSSLFSNGTLTAAGLEERGRLPIIVYPLDRTRATPLSAFCPTDVIRHALGVGPCQYVLQTEGLATETNPTPDQVMTWVERQFGRNKTEETAEEIRELLVQMVEHVGHAQDRIDRYAEFSREVAELLRSGKNPRADEGGDLPSRFGSLDQTAGRLDIIVRGNQPNDVEKRADALAKEVVQLIGKPDSLEECRRLGDELRQIGVQQDSTLSRSRMIVRWLREQAATLAADYPEFAEPSGRVREACQRRLEGR